MRGRQEIKEALQLADSIAVNPIVLGRGKSLFATVKQPLDLKLTGRQPFQNGNTVLTFEPAA